MTKRETRKLVKRNVLNGKSKQDTYDELRAVSKLPQEELGKIVRQTSSLGARQKYRFFNAFLIGLMTLTLVIKMLDAISLETESGFTWSNLLLIAVCINGLFLWAIASFHHVIYKLIAILNILAAPNALMSAFKAPFNGLEILDLMVVGCYIFLGLYLNAKLFPNYLTEKEIYQNEFGENRMRYVLKFED